MSHYGYVDVSEFDPLAMATEATEIVFEEDHFSASSNPSIATAAAAALTAAPQLLQPSASPLSSEEPPPVPLELPTSAELNWFIEAGDQHREAKQHLLRDFLRERQREFTDYSGLTVHCGTWNVNNQFDDSLSLTDWLHCEPPPDIYALGFQELDLSTMNFITQRSDREEKWTRLCLRSFPRSHDYRVVKAVRLFSTFLLVAAKDSVFQQIQRASIRSGTQATGLMGIGANKGGAAVRFQLGDTMFTFVSCHLAAGEDKLESRYCDLRDIQQKLRLVFDGTSGRYELLGHAGDSCGSRVTFCLGDLNFRLAEITREDVEVRLRRGQKGAVEELLARHDELRLARAQPRYGDIFLSYSEAEIDFWPSYKYQLGSVNHFDNEKLRVPSWCDRVLYRTEAVRCEPLRYRCFYDYVLSDHKPVSCVFRTEVARIDPSRHRRTLKRGVQWLDSLENAVLPQCVLEPGNEVHFGQLTFCVTHRASLTLRNTGRVAASWVLAAIPASSPASADLEVAAVRVSPTESRVPVGSSLQLMLDACLGPCQWPAALRRWAFGKADAAFGSRDVLVLALIGGAHIFAVPRGEATPSCYGLPLACLCRLRKPVLQTEPETLKALARAAFQLLDAEVATDTSAATAAVAAAAILGRTQSPIPAEVTRLLQAADPDCPDLLPPPDQLDALAPTAEQLAAIADALSRGVQLPQGLPPSAYLHALMLFLGQLPERRLIPAGPQQNSEDTHGLVANLLSTVFAWAGRVLATQRWQPQQQQLLRACDLLTALLARALERPATASGPSLEASRWVRAELQRQLAQRVQPKQQLQQQQLLQQQQQQMPDFGQQSDLIRL